MIGASILIYLSTNEADAISSLVIPRLDSLTQRTIDVRMHLRDFESEKWYAIPRKSSTMKVPNFPPQILIVKMCSICNYPYWVAFPTNLTLKYFHFSGENSIFIAMEEGIWDIAQTRLADAVLSFGCRARKNPALMIDIGMNTGYFSGMALAAGCRVVAFEPKKYYHPYALVTAMLSGHEERFSLHKLAASDKTGAKIPFNDRSVSESAERAKTQYMLPYVFTTRVDDIVHENVLYLKIDVEGNESAVFRGLTALLTKKTVLVIVWKHKEAERKENVQLPADHLKKFGYFVSELHHGGAGYFVALHPQVDPVLRETILAMKELNIKDS